MNEKNFMKKNMEEVRKMDKKVEFVSWKWSDSRIS